MNPAELIDKVLGDAPAHEISDGIKDILMQKSVERIEAGKPVVADSMFQSQSENDPESEVTEQEPTGEQDG